MTEQQDKIHNILRKHNMIEIKVNGQPVFYQLEDDETTITRMRGEQIEPVTIEEMERNILSICSSFGVKIANALELLDKNKVVAFTGYKRNLT